MLERLNASAIFSRTHDEGLSTVVTFRSRALTAFLTLYSFPKSDARNVPVLVEGNYAPRNPPVEEFGSEMRIIVDLSKWYGPLDWGPRIGLSD